MRSILQNLLLVTLTAASSLCASDKMSGVRTDQAPQGIGPFSQAIRAGQYLFVSGQLPLNPSTNQIVGTTIAQQTSQVLSNIEAILHSQGLTLKDVVKVEVFLKDMNDFSTMNSIYAEKFSHPVKPARQAVQVVKLPMDSLIEISCIAFISMH